MLINTWYIEAMTGYKRITTFYEDFSIADNFGTDAVIDAFRRAYKNREIDYKHLTELVMVLCCKTLEHYGSNEPLATLYYELGNLASCHALEDLEGEELAYFCRTTKIRPNQCG